MGYQALLFCPDEKLANVVTQVFNELDFSVEAVHEPFAAVKKLMAQHYDALVVDSENDQNASLLFKSARNSSFNQSSLAIALVEGQIGVAKAYRIGANLVLTKPINVEQAKGTLRVARGLLRKHSDIGVTSGGVAATALSPATSSALKAAPPEQITAPSPNPAALDERVAPLPTLASAELSAAYAKNFPTEFAGEFPELSAGLKKHGIVPIPAASTAPAAPMAPAQPMSSASAVPPGIAPARSAAAPAPAKEATSLSSSKNRIVEAEPEIRNLPIGIVSTSGSSGTFDAPTFAALGESDSAGSGASKKTLIVAAIVLVLAVLGYFGYSKFGASRAVAPAAQPASAPADSSQPAPALRPMSSPDQSPVNINPTTLASQPSRTGAAPSASATLAAGTANVAMHTVESIAANPETPAMKSGPSPMLVKSSPASHNSQPQAGERPNGSVNNKDDESEPLLALASATDNKLTGLMSSASSTVSKPSLATLKISQGVSQGLLIKRVTPTYPKTALATHVEGEVQIEATINRDGNVTNTKVLSGTPVLAHAALDAVRQWRYKPYYLDGTPVDIQTQITVKFKAH
jgi:TonB family protein